MNWLGLIVAAAAAYAGFKVISTLLRLALWLVALIALYWVCAPLLGWPTLTELKQSPSAVLEAAQVDTVVRDAERAGAQAVELAGDALKQANETAEQIREHLGSNRSTDPQSEDAAEQPHRTDPDTQEADDGQTQSPP